MQPAATRQIDSLLALPRSAKKLLAVMADSALCILTVWLAICFRFESWVSLSGYQWLAVVLSIALAIPLLTAFGFYHTVIRFVGRQTIAAALRAIGIYAIIYSAIFTAFGFPLVPRTIGVLQPLLLLIGLALVRLLASQLLSKQATSALSNEQLPGVLIYGAGHSGQQLAASLEASGKTRIVGFVDDNLGIQKASISGIPVYGPQHIHDLSIQHNVRDVLLAMPSIQRSRRNEILKLLGQSKVAIRTLPSLTDLAQGKVQETDLRHLAIEDLLGRDPVAPIISLLAKNNHAKTVMVTGAGGSIGSELCRQIVAQQPERLILLELSEYALYTIGEELTNHCSSLSHPLEIISILANVMDDSRIDQIMARYKPDTIYHAAAYKHVPLIEKNGVAGICNNALGTWHVAHAAVKHKVADMVLISTDKAVRPTSVMGASKRVCEMIVQALATLHQSDEQSTRFCMVRFGNVLGSSGSVVPKFREQILSGGPITLTHPKIERYFMTIPEAAQLVMQAGAMSKDHQSGAYVYLLDMGDAVRIHDLACTMIHLSGLTVQDVNNPNGDIAIAHTGLRPGEKLYEELLIEGNPVKTSHPKILVGDSDYIPYQKMCTFIEVIKSLEPNASAEEIKDVFDTHFSQKINWIHSEYSAGN
jgi:FlaA1/EpsC-like NDP-sugar epimerase